MHGQGYGREALAEAFASRRLAQFLAAFRSHVSEL